MVTLMIQGSKQLGLNAEGNQAKVVTLAIAALFLFANRLIDTFVPDPARPVLKMAIDLLKDGPIRSGERRRPHTP